MNKILNPGILIAILVCTALVGMVLYVLIAPATWWKPVYIRFEMDDQSIAAQAQTQDATNTVQSVEATQQIQPATLTQPPQSQQPTTSTMPYPTVQQGQPVGQVAQPGWGTMYELDAKVVNLAEPGGLRYLQVSMVLEFYPLAVGPSGQQREGRQAEAEKTAEDQLRELVDSRRPIIDDIVMTILSSKTYNDISTVEGKQDLKQELITSINEALGYEAVFNVYFTEFVIQ
jgi:flagellar basal body-associated protein FliL